MTPKLIFKKKKRIKKKQIKKWDDVGLSSFLSAKVWLKFPSL